MQNRKVKNFGSDVYEGQLNEVHNFVNYRIRDHMVMEKCINKMGHYFWDILITEKLMETELISSPTDLTTKDNFIITMLMINTVIINHKILNIMEVLSVMYSIIMEHKQGLIIVTKELITMAENGMDNYVGKTMMENIVIQDHLMIMINFMVKVNLNL